MTTIYSITGETLYQSDKPTLKEAVEAAVADGVSLGHANLADANLEGANLPGADMRQVWLQGANLRRANLSGADLSLANMKHANLAFANLSEACLRNVSLYGANLLYATLTNVNITYASVNYTIFSPSTLKGATIDGHVIISAATFGPFGSRVDNLLAVQTVDGLYFQTGCFFGTKEELLAAVESAHGGTRHERDYKLVVDFLEAYLKEEK